jgi:general secretion pathway protein K
MNQPSLKLRRSGMSILRSKKVRGAALMLALWALFLLSAMIVSWALDIDSRLTLSGTANRMLEAEAMACSGAEVALNPLIKPGSPNLNGGLGAGKTYEARITGEGGRLDLNWLVAGENPDRLEILRRYLENKGIDLNERDTMMDSLLDWVEPNTGLHRLNAPPENEDYHPPHAGGLARVDELKKVAGWAEFTSTPGWDDDFTVNIMLNSGVGGPIVDPAWASRDVLLALPGMTPGRVDRFLELRRGPDGIDGTVDDAQFNTPGDVAVALGFSLEQFNQLKLSELISPSKVQVYRVVSVGKAGDATRVVQMVFQRVGFASRLITWKEF